MDLSIIIPAYNEESRLPSTLDRTLSFLAAHFKGSHEIVVVNDGSTDGTIRVVEDFSARFPGKVRLVSYQPNQGRGVAVRKGVEAVDGDIILETDADGSVDEEAILRFYEFLHAHPDLQVAIGSRNAEGAKILTYQSPLRVFLGEAFILLAWLFFGFKSTDYVLGFKMFRRAAAKDIFAHQYDNHYLAEAEIMYVAHRRGWKFRELPVLWTDFKNSRVRPMQESIRTFRGLFKIRRWTREGRYSGPRHR